MGEITPMRQKVFRTGFKNICRSVRKKSHPPLQLGLSRGFLQDTALEIYSAHVQELLEVANQKDSDIEDFNVGIYYIPCIMITMRSN